MGVIVKKPKIKNMSQAYETAVKIMTANLILVPEREIAEITPTSVTQGKTKNNDEGCCAAAHAIDKDLSTPAVTQTDNEAGWIKLEFDKTYFFNKVVIFQRFFTDWFLPSEHDICVQREQNFRSCVDSDNHVDVSVYQGDVFKKSCGTLQMTYGLEQSDQIYTLICNADGDTVKLSRNYGDIVVFEVAVTGKCTVKLFIPSCRNCYQCAYNTIQEAEQ